MSAFVGVYLIYLVCIYRLLPKTAHRIGSICTNCVRLTVEFVTKQNVT